MHIYIYIYIRMQNAHQYVSKQCLASQVLLICRGSFITRISLSISFYDYQSSNRGEKKDLQQCNR